MPLPAIVNEAFVRQFFPHVNPLRRPLEDALPNDPKAPRGPGWVIVGVVRDAKYNSLRGDTIQPCTCPVAAALPFSSSVRPRIQSNWFRQ
jgi:hypothetical protein